MFALKALLESLGHIIHIVLNIFIWVVIIQALLTLVRPDPYNPIVQLLNKITAPIYNFIHGKVKTVFSGIDIAPLIVVICLQFLDIFLVKILAHFTASM